MKVFRHILNNKLYTIEQYGRGKTISPPKDWRHFHPIPYRLNPDAPKLPSLGLVPDLSWFYLAFET